MIERAGVDIVVNNCNYGRFVADAIRSALGQTHQPVRVVVVDDGSTDDSRTVIASFGDAIDVVLKPNGGQASALNAGFARGNGKIVMFLDADDVLKPYAAALAVRALSGAAASMQFKMDVVDADGRPTGATKPPPDLRMPSGDVARHELMLPFDLTWLPTSAHAYRRDVIERIMPLPEDGEPAGADWLLHHLTPLLGPVVSLDEVGAEYRVHGANAYEPADASLDLDHVRSSVRYAESTRRELERLAAELGLPMPRGGIASVADVANRLISLRLDRDLHPIASDTTARLLADGIRAIVRRFDTPWTGRVKFALWFAAFAVSPRPPARWLAEQFLFPERRVGRAATSPQTAPAGDRR